MTKQAQGMVESQEELSHEKNWKKNHVILDHVTGNRSSIREKRIKYRAALAAARGIAISEVPLSQVNEQISREIANRKVLGNER